MKTDLHSQIEQTKRQLVSAKPRSLRHAELTLRLRDLRLKQLKREIKLDRAA